MADQRPMSQRRRTGVSALHEFCLDLALRYCVSCVYNLNGFMEPLRTGIVRGGFLRLGLSGETQGPSTPHQIRYANLMLRSG
jgi:hypothetical protein